MTEVYESDRAIGDEREDRHCVHVHTFNTITMVADGHQHEVLGVTGPARYAGTTHIHRIKVRTSFFTDDEEGHWHWLDVMTGPAVYTMDGMHVHTYEGVTSFDDGHAHDVADSTAQAPDILEVEEVVAPPPPNTKAKSNKKR